MLNKRKAGCILAASILCVSMSLGVFASSPTDPEIPIHDENEGDSPISNVSALTMGKDGYMVSAKLVYTEASQEVQELLKDENNVKTILNDAGYTVTDDMTVFVFGAGELNYYGPGYEHNEEVQELPEEGLDVVIDLDYYDSEVKNLNNGDTIYVLHQKSDGTWEVLEGEFNRNSAHMARATVHFDSLSPVVFIKVMSNGQTVVLNKEEELLGNIDLEELKEQGEKVNSDKETVVKGTETEKKAGKSVVKTVAEKKSPKTGN